MTLARRPPSLIATDPLRSELARTAALQLLAALESPASRRGYGIDWRRWTDFLAESGRDPADATAADVLGMMERMRGRGLAAATRQRALAVVKAVYKHMVQVGAVAQNPAREVSGPKRDRTPRTPWVQPEGIRAMLLAPAEGRHGSRDRLILWILAGTGLRRRDVARIRVEDRCQTADGNPGLRVIVKGNKQGVIGLARAVDAEIARYLAGAGIVAGPLFPGRKGRPITADYIGELVKVAAARAGLDPAAVTPHALRRSFITISGKEGVSLQDRSAAVLHSSVAMTERYDRADRQGNTLAGEAVLGRVLGTGDGR